MTPPERESRPQGAAPETGEGSTSSLLEPADNPEYGAQPFQVMPPLSADEYDALKADIAERGVLVAVVKDQDGRIIDGHHRLQIAAELGIDCPVEVRKFRTDDQARDVAYALNLQRRHLSREQKRELIAGEIKDRPDDSDRSIGRRLGCDGKTVGSVRRELSGEIPHSDELTPTQRTQVKLVVELMKQRTITACLMIRGGQNVIGWAVHKHDDCDDPEVIKPAWRKYAEWSNSAEETHGILWRHVDDEGWPCPDECGVFEGERLAALIGGAS